MVGALPVCNNDQAWWLVDQNGTLGWLLESIILCDQHNNLKRLPYYECWNTYHIIQHESQLNVALLRVES